MGVRTSLFSTIKSALTSASLTASDASSSNIPVTLKGEYNNNSDKRSLPVVTISKVTNPTTGVLAFGEGFLAETEPRIMIDIYTQRLPHVEQIADQITSYLKNNKLGYSLKGIDEDDELTNPNDNKAHHKTLFLTFEYWDR